jgi:hypothetical protein
MSASEDGADVPVNPRDCLSVTQLGRGGAAKARKRATYRGRVPRIAFARALQMMRPATSAASRSFIHANFTESRCALQPCA